MAPAGESGGGGGEVDRGDEWTPTDDAADKDEKLGTEVEKKEEPVAEKKSALKDVKLGADDDKKESKEPTAEEKAAADAAAAEAEVNKDKKDTRIPAKRHKEILDNERARREAVELELAKYKQGDKIADVNAEITEAETKLTGLETKYAQQLTDGKTSEAAATMTEIRRLERSINQKTMAMEVRAAEARSIETARYDTTVERLEAQYPALNVEHDDFDKAKTAEVLELKEAYQLKGYTPSQALQKAVKLIMPPTTKAQEKAVETEARVDAKAVEAARKAAAVEKTADAVDKTPANAAKVGKEHDAAGGGAVTAKDIMKMPYKDFAKLTEDDLARARGDVL
jgi:hypothetical protein